MHVPSNSASPFSRPRSTAAALPSDLLGSIEAHVRELLGEDDPDFLEDLVTSFCESVGILCTKIEAAMAADDPDQVMAFAHQIKGSAANVGLPNVAEAWHDVEEGAHQREPGFDQRVAASLATARRVIAALSA